MKKVIYLDAGHSLKDPGAVSGNEIESVHAREVRNRLAELLRPYFTVETVPDDLDLIATIRWINQRAKGLEDGYAFAIHLNSNSGTPGIGAEGWHCAGNPASLDYAHGRNMIKTIVDKYCEVSKMENRGVFSDDRARYGRLGFVHDTHCYAGLIELCFINNKGEIAYLKQNYQLIAEGLCRGFLAAYGIKENIDMDEMVNPQKLERIYWEILMRSTEGDAGAQSYLGKKESEVRALLMASDERKEREADREKVIAIKKLIG